MDAELLLQQIDALLEKKLAPVMARLDRMEARSTDRRLDRLEQQVEELISRSNDQSVRHRHLVHKVAELEEAVATAQAK